LLPIKAKETRIMTTGNRIIAATMSVAMALPLMTATASTARPEGPARSSAKAEQAATRHHEHERAEPAARREDDHRATRAERLDHEHKDRDHD
jgi:hypothetical protein